MAAARFVDRLNQQIAYEFAASQQYVANAVYYDAQTLPRLAAFFFAQAVEERNHAMMMVQYLLDADAAVTIPGVDRARDRVQRHRRPGRARARAGAPRQRSDRRADGRRPRGERLPERAVRAVVPQGAGRGGLVDVLAAGVVRALGRRADVHRGLPCARALRSPRPPTRPRHRPPAAPYRAPAQDVLVAAADRDLLGVEMLEQRLGELARGAELVAQLGERDHATVAAGERDQALPDFVQRVDVVVQVLGYADRAPGVARARPGRRRRALSRAAARRRRRAVAARVRRAMPTEVRGCGLGAGFAGVRGAAGVGRRDPIIRPDGSGASPRASRSSRTSTSRLGPWRRGRGSSTRPPPSVSGGATWRTTIRSPAAGTIGCSSRTCQKRPPSHARRAAASRVPWWIWHALAVLGLGGRRTRARRPRGTSAARRRRSRPARRRARSRRPRVPVRFTATRWPGRRPLERLVVHLHAAHAYPPSLRAGSSSSSPRPISPDHSVPVTTVPAPRIVNTRSTCKPGRRDAASAREADRLGGSRSSAARSSSMPRPVRADTGTASAAREQLGGLDQRELGIGEVALGHRHDARSARRAPRARRRARASAASPRRRPRSSSGTGRSRSRRRPSSARTARGRGRRPRTAGGPTGARGWRSRARSRSPGRAPRAAGRCRRRSARGSASVLPWSMWPAVPSVSGAVIPSRVRLAPAAASSSSSSSVSVRGSSSSRPSWIRRDHRRVDRAERPRERLRVPVERHDRPLELEQRQRRRPPTFAAARVTCARSPIAAASRAARAASVSSSAASIASTGISVARACGVAVQPQRRLERGQRQLVDPQRPGQRMPAGGRHRVPPAHDQARPAVRPSSLSPEQQTSAAPAATDVANSGSPPVTATEIERLAG